MGDDQSIAARTPFTPAERAVLSERAENLKVSLSAFQGCAKVRDSQALVESLIPCAREWQAILNMVNDKLHRTITDDLMKQLGEG